jgi:hypothetical protein
VKVVPGCKVKLLHDITTRGNRKFRAGVVMTVDSTDGGIWLSVRVRSEEYSLRMLKKEVNQRSFEVVYTPEVPGE